MQCREELLLFSFRLISIYKIRETEERLKNSILDIRFLLREFWRYIGRKEKFDKELWESLSEYLLGEKKYER